MLTTLIAALSLNVAHAEETAPAPAGEPAPEATNPPRFSEMYARKSPAGFDGVRHGFRAGYVYANQAEKTGLLRSPNLFAIGYEAEVRVASGEGLDFIIVPNITLLGLNQGVALPSASTIIGLSLYDTFKAGVGANLSPSTDGTWVHMVAAVAFVPAVGKLQLPIAVTYIPSETGDFRVGASVGVNWPKAG